MKKFFGKIKDWFIRHKPTKRRLIQVYAALLYNANLKGFASGKIYSTNAYTKYVCVPGLNCYSCPGAVGSCPLGSLQNALANSGTRAPFYVFGIIILFGLLLGRTICGFLCPMGLLQDLLYKIKSPKLRKSKVTRVLSYFKYFLLVAFVIILPIVYTTTVPAFCKYLCPFGVIEGAISLLSNPSNATLWATLGVVFVWKFCLMVLIVLGSIFVYRLFCRFLCPLGALYSLFCRVAMIGIKLDKQKCVDCGLCIQTCKMDIKHVGDHECINCGDCLKVCPTQAITWKGSKIFLHPNAIEEGGESASGEKVPLSSILASSTGNGGTLQINAGGAAAAAVQPAFASPEVEETAAAAAEMPAEAAESAVNAENCADGYSGAEMQTALTKQQKKAQRKALRGTLAYQKKRNKILEICAWAAALAVLLTALIYYNFIHEESAVDHVYSVGETYHDFTAQKFFGEDDATYTLQDDLDAGKIVILNFWYIGCGGCEEELPYFGELAQDENYAGKVSVVVVHEGDDPARSDALEKSSSGTPYIENYITKTMKWEFYDSLTWIIDTEDTQYYLELGGLKTYPITAIIDSDGVIQFMTVASMTRESLYSAVDDVIANQSDT